MSSTVTVVKIDLARSRLFMADKVQTRPDIRQKVLENLLRVSQQCFPDSEQGYRDGGSYYKAEGDAVYYILGRPSVALRGAIQFMQNWFNSVPDFPDCRVMLDMGQADLVDTPGGAECVGCPFENIAGFEKEIREGTICLTEAVLNSCDHTMARFAYYRTADLPSGTVRIYQVHFSDPRTIADSSLVHALFVAHPESAEARQRLFELFLVEYLLEKQEISDLDSVRRWASEKGYPLPPPGVGADPLLRMLGSGKYFERLQDGDLERYTLTSNAISRIRHARAAFQEHRERCVQEVSRAVCEATRSNYSVTQCDLAALVEDYLCALFSQIRVMANYFRDNLRFFETASERFFGFDYVLRRHLPNLDSEHIAEWRSGLLAGLRAAANENNLYIAAVFHNVLATYYLNRSTQASPYQIERLKERVVYLDTNVLYALRVPASNYHELAHYVFERLISLGCTVKVFPFTTEEYENSLLNVERDYRRAGGEARLMRDNPWLYQEFKLHEGRYFSDIAICRQTFSLRKDKATASLDDIDAELCHLGVSVEREHTAVPEGEAIELWNRLRNEMTSSSWDLERYWDFMYEAMMRPEELKVHDAHCVLNVDQKAAELGADELGPKVFFVTLDYRRMVRLHKTHRSIVGLTRFLEFVLPYLFLTDQPVEDAAGFPNRLLAAQLGTLLVARPPKIYEIVAEYCRDPESFTSNLDQQARSVQAAAKVLSSKRFESLWKPIEELDESKKSEMFEKIAECVDGVIKAENDRYYAGLAHGPVLQKAQEELSQTKAKAEDLESKVEKLQRKLRYWKSQARRRPGPLSG